MNEWPRKGDSCVDLRVAARSWDSDSIGPEMTVHAVTTTVVITNTGAKYHRAGLTPINEGPQSARRLVSSTDPRVLCIRGRRLMADLANRVENLSRMTRTDPADVIGDFSKIITAVAEARGEYIALTSAATQREQEIQG